jgi:hypothetical protein
VTPLSGLWHLLSFAVPALATGCLTALLAKWLWRAEFRTVKLVRLGAVCCAASVFGFACCIAWLGQDGRMAAYAVMVICCALSTWWFARRSG